MHFGENQLSRSLIGLSPLTTGHPPTFQRWWVRPSTRSYPRFSLPMARSPRFGSRTHDYTPSSDSLSLRLPHHGLTSPHALTRRLILQKAHHHPTTPQRGAKALMDCRQTVSGTLSLPSRGTFHLSLTVLVHYRSPGSIQAYQVVLADSRQISGVRRYSRTPQERSEIFAYRTITAYGAAFQRTSTNPELYHSPAACQYDQEASHNPDRATPDRYHTRPV
jgi:hypothetical protein